MQPWKLLPPSRATMPCDAVHAAHPMLVSPRDVEAVLLDANPLADAGPTFPTNFNAPAIAVRSGRLEPDEDDEIARIDAARRTWSGEGRARLDEVWPRLVSTARERGVELWLHPVAGDVLGDVPALKALATGDPPGLEGVLLEPAALLTAGMLDDAEEHLTRILEAMEASGLVRAVLVTNLGGDPDAPVRVPLEEGRLDPGLLRGVAERASARAPVALLEPDAG